MHLHPPMADELITSAKNPKIRRLLELQQKSSLRRAEGIFVVEGLRELRHCLEAGFKLESLFYCPGICARPELGRESFAEKESIFALSPEAYSRIAVRDSSEGVVATVHSRCLSLAELSLPSNPLVIVLESVEKPGNLGAVLRSADAAGADALLVCDPLTDLYNPNLIRASLGAVFTVPSVCCSSSQAISFLKEKGIRILTAQLQDSSLYYDTDMTRGTALVMGTESTGLTGEWREAADAHIRIPMNGKMDSLNVSVSAAILMFEAVRQRNG